MPFRHYIELVDDGTMDLRQLRTFVHVAEVGSLSKASDRLHVAQPALSRQVRALEDELKVALFTRHGRGMVLTETGALLLERATNILRQVEEARSDVISFSGDVHGSVVLGMPPTVADVLAGPLAERFQALYPNVQMRFVAAFTAHLIDWLQSGAIDLAILYDPESPGHLRIQPLLMEGLFLIAAAKAKLSLHRGVPFKRLADEALLLPTPQHSLRVLIERGAAEAGIQLSVAMEADSLTILKDLASRGLGSTILPLPPVHRDVEEMRLSAAPIVEPALSRRLVLATPTDRPISNATRRFSEVISEEVSGMVETGIWVGLLL